MKKIVCYILLLVIFFSGCKVPNHLTKNEKENGWLLLFDGKSAKGWRGAFQHHFPKNGWKIEHGMIVGELKNGEQSSDAGDLVTENKFSNFDLRWEWKLDSGANSGVKYFIADTLPKIKGGPTGYEYQLIDDENYIYNGEHLPLRLKTASLYDIIPANKPDTKMGIWHQSRIIIREGIVQHWLDNQKVLEYDLDSDEFLELFRKSKFHADTAFAKRRDGYILLQDHGYGVSYKNIKLKPL